MTTPSISTRIDTLNTQIALLDAAISTCATNGTKDLALNGMRVVTYSFQELIDARMKLVAERDRLTAVGTPRYRVSLARRGAR